MDKSKRKSLKRRVRLRTIFFLAIALASNSFAWFIYTTKVSSSITAKVREWKVSFDVNGSAVDRIIELNVESIYPGMESVNQEITISNSGESSASVEYEIVDAVVLGDDLKDSTMTDEEILEYLETNYPFSIVFDLSSTSVLPNDDTSASISVVWPYESGDDELDTYWGMEAYEYHRTNPTVQSIVLTIRLTAFQAEEE